MAEPWLYHGPAAWLCVAGLIVLGNQGLGGKFSRMRRFLMGSVSERVTRYARCSVLVVREDLYDRPPA